METIIPTESENSVIDKINDQELEIFSILHNPIAATEILFSDLGNLSEFDEFKFSEVRKYQWDYLSWDMLLFDNGTYTEKEFFNLKKGMAETYILGGRLTGKSLLGLIVDATLALFHNTFRKGSVSSADAEKIKKVMEQIFVPLEFHPILKLLNIRVIRNPYQAKTPAGTILESVNSNIAGKNPGGNWHGRHDEKNFEEEASYLTNQVTHEKLMAQAEMGCIHHYTGMTTFAKESPMGKIFYDLKNEDKIINFPSYVNHTWDDAKEEAAIREFGGKSCFDDKTEILTDNGWRSVENINIADKAVSWDISANKTTYEKIDNILKYDHDGPIFSFNNLFIDFLLTDNHKIPFRTLRKGYRLIDLKTVLAKKPIRKEYVLHETDTCLECNKRLDKSSRAKQRYFCSVGCKNKYTSQYIFYPVNELHVNQNMNWKGIEPKFINVEDLQFKIEDFLKFLGWFISEGCVCEIKEQRGKSTWIHWRINIFQSKCEEYINEIREVLGKMGLRNKQYKGNFVFTNKKIGKYLIENCGKYSKNKKVPSFVRNLSPRLINIFLDAFNKGDGDGKRGKYWSISPKLIDDLQELIIKSGNYASIGSRDDKKNILYEITERKSSKEPIIYVNKIKSNQYNGKIWCVETKTNNTIYIRRNKKCMWSGNSSGYQVQIDGQVIENGESVFIIEKIRDTYLRDAQGTPLPIKTFEINTNNFFRFKDIVIVDRPNNVDSIHIHADIGEGSAPTEIIVLSKIKDVYKYLYNITTFKIAPDENEVIFRYLIETLKANVVGLDITSGGGKALFCSLARSYNKEQDGKVEEHIFSVSFNEKTAIGFKLDEKGNATSEHIEEFLVDWSIQRLKHIFYNNKIRCLYDLKLDSQFDGVIVMKSGNRTVYGNKTQNHLFQAFQVFSIVDWNTEFKSINSVGRAKPGMGSCGTRKT